MRHVAGAGLLLVWAAAPTPAVAQAQGSYPATLFCEPVGGTGALRASLTVEIGEGKASYAARFGNGSETGRGTLNGGRLSLTGSGRVQGISFSSRYTGDVGGRGGTLVGSQTWSAGGKPLTRGCQLVLGDGRS